MFLCILPYVPTHSYTFLNVYTYIYIYVHIPISSCICIHTRTYLHVFSYISIYSYTFIHQFGVMTAGTQEQICIWSVAHRTLTTLCIALLTHPQRKQAWWSSCRNKLRCQAAEARSEITINILPNYDPPFQGA